MQYISGETVPLFGEKYTLLVRASKTVNTVRVEGDIIILTCNTSYPWATKKRIMDWFYRNQLAGYLNEAFPKWQEKMQAYYVRLSLRDMKTRWGSCTPKTRAIRLNIQLATRPKEQIDYVIVHELAHLQEANHSAAFWAIVEQYIPHCKEVRHQLKYGSDTGTDTGTEYGSDDTNS